MHPKFPMPMILLDFSIMLVTKFSEIWSWSKKELRLEMAPADGDRSSLLSFAALLYRLESLQRPGRMIS